MRLADLLFHAHSGLRYLVLFLAAVAVVGAGLTLRRSQSPPLLRGVFRVYAGLLALQAALGIALLFLRPFYPRLVGHAILMLLAVGVAHGLGRGGRAAPRRIAGAAGLSLLLIVAGVFAIRSRLL